ncbi:hypothetical protein EJ110_NYTH56878 [Nymphaea thermarum]|nr:hypothetical protein EJ110_NYTH56878 [Nymphaea thermarum]
MVESSHHDKLQWEEDQVQFLFDMMLEQAKIPGMRTSGGLKETAMKVVEQKMMEAYGRMFTLEKIRNKLKKAKHDLQVMKEILNASGFGWDPDKKIIQADDNVWKEYIPKYPNRKKYKLPATWKYYEHAMEIWGSSTALGDNRSVVDSRALDDIQINVDEQDENDFQLPTSPMDSNAHTQGETSNSMRGNKRARTMDEISTVIFILIMWLMMERLKTQDRPTRTLVHTDRLEGAQFVYDCMHGHPRNCLDLLRVDQQTNALLCNLLKSRELLCDAREITIEEQVAMFVVTLGHDQRNRRTQYDFKYFNLVLKAILRIAHEYVGRRDDTTPARVRGDLTFLSIL